MAAFDQGRRFRSFAISYHACRRSRRLFGAVAKPFDLGLNQILHEKRACQNLCFLDTVRHHSQQQSIYISHIFWCQVEFRSEQIILSDITPNPVQANLDQ